MRIGIVLVCGLLLSGCVNTLEQRNKEQAASPEIQTIMPIIIEQCRLSAEGQSPAVSYAALQKHGFKKARLSRGYVVGINAPGKKTIFSGWDHVQVIFDPIILFGEFKGCKVITNRTENVVTFNMSMLKEFVQAGYAFELKNRGTFSMKKGNTKITSTTTKIYFEGNATLELSISKSN